jgi:hypothetical protein
MDRRRIAQAAVLALSCIHVGLCLAVGEQGTAASAPQNLLENGGFET